MSDEYTITYVEKPEESAWGIIGQGINAYNEKQAGDDTPHRICYVVRAPDEEIVGGVIAVTFWDWLYIDLMWIKEDFRGRGYGHRLLTLTEEDARKLGAKKAFLDTFSFQAPDFYKKHGYEVFGELKEFPPGHQRYYMTKDL